MNQSLTVVGIAVLALLFWVFSQNATGEARKVYNLFLIVLLAGMVLSNWGKISPLFIKTTV